MREVFAFLALVIAAAISWFGYQQELLALIFAAGAAFFYVVGFRKQSAENRRNSDETKQTDSQLRAEVIAVQKLAIAKLTDASDEFKTQVAEKVADAAQHLGYPQMNSRRVYGSDHVLNWNKEGLSKIAEARRLIEGYTPPAGK